MDDTEAQQRSALEIPTETLDPNARLEARRIEKANLYLSLFERAQRGEISFSDIAKKLANIDIAREEQMRLFRTQRNEAQNTMLIDPLTKLFNRRWLDSQLKISLAEVSAIPQKEYYLLYFDIDFFKSVNTKYGHAVGDEIIKCITKLSRENEPIARIGGEEFVQIVDLTDIGEAGIEAFEKLKTIRDRYAEEMKKSSADIFNNSPVIDLESTKDPIPFSTLSFGATRIREHDTIQSLLTRGGELMLHSKSNGRNSISTDENDRIVQYPNGDATAA